MNIVLVLRLCNAALLYIDQQSQYTTHHYTIMALDIIITCWEHKTVRLLFKECTIKECIIILFSVRYVIFVWHHHSKASATDPIWM